MVNTHFKCAICANATAVERDCKLKGNCSRVNKSSSCVVGMFFFAVFVCKVAKVVQCCIATSTFTSPASRARRLLGDHKYSFLANIAT